MSDKGKAKGSAGAADDAVIDFTLSDSDDNDFFMRPVPVFRKAAEAPARSVTPPCGSDDESSRKRKKVTKQKGKGPDLPEWTRRHMEEKEKEKEVRERRKGSRQRSSASASRETQNVVLLITSDDEDPVTSTKVKGKGKAKPPSPVKRRKTRRDSLELTPPPVSRPEQTASMRRTLEEFMAENAAEAFREAEEAAESLKADSTKPRTASRPENELVVSIRVRMVADDDRRVTGSEKALKHYEMPRTIHMGLDQPLEELAEAVAHRIQKTGPEIILVYNDRRIFAHSRTPRELGIYDAAEMVGYEKHVWKKIAEQKAADVARLLEGVDAPPLAPSSPPPTSTPAVEEPESADNKIKVKLRGHPGTINLHTAMTSKVLTILRFYCTKFSLTADPANMYLGFDGEKFTGDSCLGDMEIEDGDLIEVGGT